MNIEHRRRGERVCIWFAEPMKARAEALVVDRYPTVEHQGPRRELRDRRCDGGEAPRVVVAVPAVEPDALAVLVRMRQPSTFSS